MTETTGNGRSLPGVARAAQANDAGAGLPLPA